MKLKVAGAQSTGDKTCNKGSLIVEDLGIHEQADSLKANTTQQVLDSQEQVAVDILQGFHAMQEELNTCSFNSDFSRDLCCDVIKQPSLPPYSPQPIGQGVLIDLPEVTGIQTNRGEGGDKTPVLEENAGWLSSTANYKSSSTTHAKQSDIPVRDPSIPVRQPSLFLFSPPSDKPLDQSNAETDAELLGPGMDQELCRVSSHVKSPPAGRSPRLVHRAVVEDTYAALVHESFMQNLEGNNVMVVVDEGEGEEYRQDDSQGEGEDCDRGDLTSTAAVEDLDGEEDWVESYMTQRSQTVHSIVLRQAPQLHSVCSSSSQTIFIPSPNEYVEAFSPQLDPNITVVHDTYAPAEFDAAMDEEGDDDAATQLRGSLDWNVHIVPETCFEDAPILDRGESSCASPCKIPSQDLSGRTAGDADDIRSVVSSIHGMPGDDSMCVIMTQSPSAYSLERQVASLS